MKGLPSLHAFLSHLIDYAGLFPPANLELDAAIQNHFKYVTSEDSWILGPFIIPITKIHELQAYADLYKDHQVLRLSVVGRKSGTEAECLLQLQEDLEQIQYFMNQQQDWVKVETLEVPLPPIVPSQYLLQKMMDGAKRIGVNLFCEVAFLERDDWHQYLTNSIEAITHFNATHHEPLGVKIRTGGIKAEMIPSTKQVAQGISLCSQRKLPLKFTAGLHHPIRMYRDEVHAEMHGFLNIFMASMLAYHYSLDADVIEDIISDERDDHFVIHDDHLAWKELHLTSQEVRALRNQFVRSFGSCSFDEPRDELLELLNKRGP
ncbi:hypothetical protein [Rubeoparvulum massiliense]|uniref:hypothetical protein n=1 Tax=Rubeoparvulum massiliense TaxID=1631346 RepID=UPI00065E6518|nr:hypothetical protein [Rubeoparvulum massiliense]